MYHLVDAIKCKYCIGSCSAGSNFPKKLNMRIHIFAIDRTYIVYKNASTNNNNNNNNNYKKRTVNNNREQSNCFQFSFIRWFQHPLIFILINLWMVYSTSLFHSSIFKKKNPYAHTLSSSWANLHCTQAYIFFPWVLLVLIFFFLSFLFSYKKKYNHFHMHERNNNLKQFACVNQNLQQKWISCRRKSSH